MNKDSFLGIIILVIIVSVIQFIQKIGIEIIILCIVIAIIVFYFYSQEKNKLPEYPEDEFGPIFKDYKEAKVYLNLVSKKNQNNYMKLLALHQIRESFDIAFKSKKLDIAENRINYAKDRLNDLDKLNILPDKMNKIHNKFNTLLTEYETRKYINQINICIDKITNLKTQKSKDKYYQLAKKHINEGYDNNKTNNSEIETFAKKLDNTYSRYKIK